MTKQSATVAVQMVRQDLVIHLGVGGPEVSEVDTILTQLEGNRVKPEEAVTRAQKVSARVLTWH
jgi:hypothetical protein